MKHKRWFTPLVTLVVTLTLVSSTLPLPPAAARPAGALQPAKSLAPAEARAIISWEYDQLQPAVAFGDGLNQYLVVWEDHHWGWGDDWDINAQRVNRDGTLAGGTLGIAWEGTEHQLAPAVAYDTYWDRFLVTWEYEYSTDDHDIYCRLVGSDGSLITGALGVAAGGSFESNPSVAYNPGSGEYLVVWEHKVGSDEFAQNDIYARRVTADGVSVGGEFIIANGALDESAPAVAVDTANGRYFVVWHERSSLGNYDILGQRVNADGSLAGGKVTVSADSADQLNPRLAFGPLANQFLVVWQDRYDWDVDGQRVDTAGTLQGSQVYIAGSGDDYDCINPDVAYNATANAFEVTWERVLNVSDHDILRRTVGSTGTMMEEQAWVTTLFTLEARPVVAAADDLSYLVAWEDGRNATLGVDVYGEALTIGLPRFSGNVYEGDVGDESTPLSGVTIELRCSNNSGQQGGLVGRATTDVNGAYQLVAADVCEYYNIVEIDPAGFTSAGATSTGGTVVNANWIQYAYPLTAQDLTNNKFWDHPPSVSTDCNSCSDCSAKLNGTYDVVRLTTDLGGISDECILFGGDHTTFDCQGHTIDGENAQEFSFGIRISGNSGNTIQNCTVSDLESGISLMNAYDNDLLDNTVTGARSGIHLADSNSNTLSGNQLTGNEYGVLLTRSDSNALSNNTICKQNAQDIYAPNATTGNTRSGDKCDYIYNWNGDNGVSACDLVCTPNVATTCLAAGDCQNALNGDFNLVTLTQDLTIAGGLVVHGNHLTLDCDGHTLTGGGTGAGVVIDSRLGVGVRNCTIRQYGSGVEVRSSALSNIQSNTITQNNIGVRLSALDPLVKAQSNTISTNNLANNALYGLALDDAHSNSITSNTMTGNGEYSLWVTGDACNNTVTSNSAGNGGSLFYLHDNPSAGTVPGGSYDEVVLCNAGNAVVENLSIDNGTGGGDGLLLVNASAAQVRTNTLRNTNGIAVIGSNDVAIHHNNVSASISPAISLDGSLRADVYTNTLQNNGGAGIELRAGADDAEVYDNTIRNNRQGIQVEGSDDAYLHDNRVSDNTAEGVNVTLASGTGLADNTITRNDIGLFFDTDTSGATVNNNKICYNESSDLYNTGLSNTGDNNTCALSAYWWDDGITPPNQGCDKKCIGYYQYHYGYSFHNPSKSSLSFGCPWDGCQGDYVDTFGEDEVYTSVRICIGVPLCLPFVGCWCLGYETSVSTGIPDPHAAIYYGAAYWHSGKPGECTGMSNTSLRFYYHNRYPSEYQSGAQKVSDLTYSGDLENAIDASHGAIMSWEIVSRYLDALASGGTPANQVLAQVKAAVDSNQLGSLVIHAVTAAHTVVATNYRDDGNTARIYLYDSNVPKWSTEYAANEDDYPHIVIDKVHNTWSYSAHPDFDKIWFLPYSVSNGGFEIPLSVHQLLGWGAADTQVEDEAGNRLGWMDGVFLNEIPGAAPMPDWGGDAQEDPYQFYLLPAGNYTAHITGRATGVYTTVAFLENSMVLLHDIQAGLDTDDTLTLYYQSGEPPIPAVTLETFDSAKDFSLTLGEKFGSDTGRLYAIREATVAPDAPAVVRVTDDYDALAYTNRGPRPVPYCVEFQNTMTKTPYQPGDPLPKASRCELTIGPMETHVLRPDDWLDLNKSGVGVTLSKCGDNQCSAGEDHEACPEDCDAAECMEPYDDMHIDSDTLLCSGTYELSDDGEEGVIILDGDGASLDCNGAKLVGDGAGTGILSAGTDGVSARGCLVEGYAYGVRLVDATNPTFSQSAVSDSAEWAIEAQGTEGAQIAQNIVRDNGNGVRIAAATGTALSQNVICPNADLDVLAEDSSGSSGVDNMCTAVSGWADAGQDACTYVCMEEAGDQRLYLPVMIK